MYFARYVRGRDCHSRQSGNLRLLSSGALKVHYPSDQDIVVDPIHTQLATLNPALETCSLS